MLFERDDSHLNITAKKVIAFGKSKEEKELLLM